MNDLISFMNCVSIYDESLRKEVRELEESSGYSIQELVDLFKRGCEITKRGD